MAEYEVTVEHAWPTQTRSGGPVIQVPLASVGPDLVAPTHLFAKTQHEGAEVEFDVVIDDRGTPQCRRLEVRTEDGSVGGEMLRRIPVARLLRMAVTAAARKLEPKREGEPDPDEPWVRDMPSTERMEFYRDYAKGARAPRRGSLLTDENLRQVAELYRAAIKRGDPPTQMVAEAMHVARSTAARWVGKARERGFLGPSMRGRAGEAS